MSQRKKGRIIVMEGIQWGDEGKGRLVDLLGKLIKFFIRIAGGANAGHTLCIGDEQIITHLVPSGVTYPGSMCLLGNDMVIDPNAFQSEVAELKQRGFFNCEILGVSPLANLVMPYCFDLERVREKARGKAAVGTTGRGIGPTYELRARRLGIRVEHLRHFDYLAGYVPLILNEINPELRYYGEPGYTPAQILSFLEQAAQIFKPYFMAQSVSQIVHRAKVRGDKVLIEGAQGSELDLTHGTYPYVTSSSTIAGGACSGAGIGPHMIDEVYGVTKLYTTRVGGGPFQTRMPKRMEARIRKIGNEFGASTGRPRNVGWLDLTQLKHAARINGLTGFFITKADVLSNMPVKICTHYLYSGRQIHDFDNIDSCQLDQVKPVYEEFEPFGDISGCRSFDDLPGTAQHLFRRIESTIEVPLLGVSVGKERNEIVKVRRF